MDEMDIMRMCFINKEHILKYSDFQDMFSIFSKYLRDELIDIYWRYKYNE